MFFSRVIGLRQEFFVSAESDGYQDTRNDYEQTVDGGTEESSPSERRALQLSGRYCVPAVPNRAASQVALRYQTHYP